MKLKLDTTIKVDNLLTLATIIGSVIAFLTSWAAERDLKELQRADRMRAAAALSIAKLERWQVLHLSLYDEIQPTLVETSEMLVSNFDVGKARDYFWKTLDRQHVQILKSIQEERVDTAYLDLLAFEPSYREQYVRTLKQLREVERQAFTFLKLGCQKECFPSTEDGRRINLHSSEMRCGRSPWVHASPSKKRRR